METKHYKRTSREMPQEVKSKIAAAMTGKKHSEATKQLISQQLVKYWKNFPQVDNSENSSKDSTQSLMKLNKNSNGTSSQN